MAHARLHPDALRAAMKARDMNVRQLARVTGVDREDISAMLDSKSGGDVVFGLEYRRRIAAALDVPLEQLWQTPRAKAPVTVEVDSSERIWVPPSRERSRR